MEVDPVKMRDELEQYLGKAQRYRLLLSSGGDSAERSEINKAERENLRLGLNRDTGRLEPLIEQIMGKAIRIQQLGRVWNPFNQAFRRVDPSDFGMTLIDVDTVIDITSRAIGRLESITTLRPSRYQLTSPLWWVERFYRWKPVSSAVGWIKAHRLLSILITFIVVTAAFLSILESIFQWIR